MPLLLLGAVLLVAALAFNLANLEQPGPEVPGAGGSDLPSFNPGALADAFPLIWGAAILFLIAFVAFGIYAFLHGKKPEARKGSWAYLLRYVALIALFLFVLLFGRQLAAPEAGGDGSGSNGGGGDGGGGTPTSGIVLIAGIPLAAFLAAAFFAGLVLLWLLLRPAGVSRRAALPVSKEASREPAKAVIRDAIRELELGSDVRSTILLCFHRFCSLLGTRGIRAQDPLTPRELEGLAIRELHVSRDATSDLTSLFEEARYSDHSLQEDHRRRALSSLDRIRAALEAPAWPPSA